MAITPFVICKVQCTYVTAARATTSSQAHIKLNPKKLYQSDGYSVKELLKVYIVYLNLDNVIEIIILMIKMIAIFMTAGKKYLNIGFNDLS